MENTLSNRAFFQEYELVDRTLEDLSYDRRRIYQGIDDDEGLVLEPWSPTKNIFFSEDMTLGLVFRRGKKIDRRYGNNFKYAHLPSDPMDITRFFHHHVDPHELVMDINKLPVRHIFFYFYNCFQQKGYDYPNESFEEVSDDFCAQAYLSLESHLRFIGVKRFHVHYVVPTIKMREELVKMSGSS